MNKEIQSYGTHQTQKITLYTTGFKSNKSIIILIHGGFFKPIYRSDIMDPLAESFCSKGHTVANIEYPCVGDGFTAIQMIESMINAYNFIVKKFSNKKYTVVGHSAGGYYALMLGIKQMDLTNVKPTHLPHQIITLAPFADLWQGHVDRLFKNGDAIYNFVQSKQITEQGKDFYKILSPINYQILTQVAVIHGKEDTDVPVRYSYLLLSNSKIVFPKFNTTFAFMDCGHMELIDPEFFIWHIINL